MQNINNERLNKLNNLINNLQKENKQNEQISYVNRNLFNKNLALNNNELEIEYEKWERQLDLNDDINHQLTILKEATDKYIVNNITPAKDTLDRIEHGDNEGLYEGMDKLALMIKENTMNIQKNIEYLKTKLI